MTTGSSKRNAPVPALSGARKPRQDIRVARSIFEEELHLFDLDFQFRRLGSEVRRSETDKHYFQRPPEILCRNSETDHEA
uniref:Uncharacterized protein n=1 Tax=Candidatus Kentrum sp. SD TaxID=2126332 RepID=A0A451BJ41_9GAMM|nr:MAG: hypothetical protein BECKSD772D_GA0070982_101148 [Candidatus Kentron sp. SD]